MTTTEAMRDAVKRSIASTIRMKLAVAKAIEANRRIIQRVKHGK